MNRLVKITGATVGIAVLSRGETLMVDWQVGETEPPIPLHPGA